jgi:uncharacterized membrane protein (UPF0127 family)
MRQLFSLRGEDNIVVCGRCLVADTPFVRMRGLLGRKKLEPNEGLLLTPCSSIHTWFMSFAIDVVYLDSDLTVLGIREGVKPWRMTGWRGARSVLELPAGACEQKGLRPGDRLELDDCVEESASVLFLLRQGDDSQVVVGRGPLSAATRTVSAMGDLNVGVSAVVVRQDDDLAS